MQKILKRIWTIHIRGFPHGIKMSSLQMYNWQEFPVTYLKKLINSRKILAGKIKAHSIFILVIILDQVMSFLIKFNRLYINFFPMFEMYKNIYMRTFQINGLTYQNSTLSCEYWSLCLVSSSVNACQGSLHSRSLRTLLFLKNMIMPSEFWMDLTCGN